MNQLTFLSLRHEHDRMPWQLKLTPEERNRYDRCARVFTRNNLAEWLKCSVEPWRLYDARRPDDLPPPNGDPRALRKLMIEEAGL